MKRKSNDFIDHIMACKTIDFIEASFEEYNPKRINSISFQAYLFHPDNLSSLQRIK